MLKQFSLALLTLSLIGCGGGGSSESTTPTPPPPPPNNPPVANGDSYEVGMNVATQLSVLDNDSDADAFSLTDLTDPTNGSVINNGDNIVYTPNNGYTGQDSFSYTITDSIGQTATATVDVTVVNLPPTTQSDQVTTKQSETITFDPLANDVSPAGHTLTILSLSVPSQGAVTHDGSTITYIPNTGYVGDDSFIYVVEDSYGDEATATVSVTVENVLPELIDDALTITQNQSTTIDVLDNDKDAAGDHLTITKLAGVAHGEARIEGNKVVYTPTLGYAGTETITYTVSDNYSAEQEASIIVTIENVEPTANDDVAFVEIDQAILIDVIGNDHDVTGDTLTIQSVSAPQNGSVEIVDGQINYQPNSGFEGDDSFGYTIVDSYGASHSAFVTVKVANKLTVEGKLVGYEKEGTVVTVQVGDSTHTASTDAQGNFSVEIAITQASDLVIAYADDAASNYNLRAYWGTLESLIALDENNDNAIDGIHITDLTTAEYELVFKLLENREANTAEELSLSQFHADSYFQMQMAIVSDIINSNNGIALPTGYDSVNTFIRSTTEMSQQLARWREEQSTLYHDTFTKLLNDTDLSSYPADLASGEHVLSESAAFAASTYSPGYSYSLSVNGAAGKYDGKYSAAVNRINNSLSVEFSADMPTDRYFFTYCSARDYEREGYNYLNYKKFELTKIYSTSFYDVYLQNITIDSQQYSSCNFDSTNFYNTVRVYKKQPWQVTAGSYYINVQNIFDEGLDSVSYENQTAVITLNNDASFVDNNDSDNPLSGVWSSENDELTLTYSDGRVFTYYRAIDMNGSPQTWGLMHKDGQLLSAFDSDMFEKTAFTWSNTTGLLSWDVFPILDPVIDEAGRYNFQNDGKALYEWLSADGEISSSSSPYTWTLEDNKYTLTRYIENGSTVDFCDVTDANCYLYIRRGMEIVGSYNGVYYAKGFYKRFNEDGSLSREVNSIYQVLFTPQ